ncbi:MAG: Crp/Fnr family transcriptional regulator, partial [Saprospiraceae bacterium]|nr:Crp/Fnr family transcriptional regulator [Saprospiraceae bacterium]
LYGPGEYLGYHAIILDGSHDNFANALSDCSVRLIPKEAFRKKLFGSRDLATYFIKLFASRATQEEEKLIEMAYDSVRKKVSNALLVFAAKQAPESDQCTLTLSRDELAAMAGTAKETLIRTLSDLKAEGVISVQGKSIEIPSLTKLSQIIH